MERRGPGAVVVAVGGLVASGKSTVARRLAHALDAELLSADAVRVELLERGVPRALETGFSPVIYAELLRRAEPLAAAGRRVVLDAAFPTRASRAAVRRLARAHGHPFRFVECRCDPSLCTKRLGARERTGDPRGWLALFEEVRRVWEPVDELPAPEYVVVDTSGLPPLPDLTLEPGEPGTRRGRARRGGGYRA